MQRLGAWYPRPLGGQSSKASLERMGDMIEITMRIMNHIKWHRKQQGHANVTSRALHQAQIRADSSGKN